MKIGMKRMHDANFGLSCRSGMVDINNMTNAIINKVVAPPKRTLYTQLMNLSLSPTFYLPTIIISVWFSI